MFSSQDSFPGAAQPFRSAFTSPSPTVRRSLNAAAPSLPAAVRRRSLAGISISSCPISCASAFVTTRLPPGAFPRTRSSASVCRRSSSFISLSSRSKSHCRFECFMFHTGSSWRKFPSATSSSLIRSRSLASTIPNASGLSSTSLPFVRRLTHAAPLRFASFKTLTKLGFPRSARNSPRSWLVDIATARAPPISGMSLGAVCPASLAPRPPFAAASSSPAACPASLASPGVPPVSATRTRPARTASSVRSSLSRSSAAVLRDGRTCAPPCAASPPVL